MVPRAVVIRSRLCAARNRTTGAFGGMSAPVNWLPYETMCASGGDMLGLYFSVGILVFLFSFLRIIGLFAACICCWNII